MALALAAAWAAVAVSLWQSRTPAGLELPDVRLGLDRAVVERAERYERFFRFEFVASTLVLLGVLVLYARHGARFARESAAGPIGTGMLLGMLGLALVWLSQVPFRLLTVWWDRRYDQTESGYVETLFANWFELGAEFLFVSFALVVVMALARWLGRRWWLAAAPAFVALATLFSFVFPYLTPTEPLERDDLQRAGRELAAVQGVDSIPLRVEDVTDFTSAPNAYAAGLGPSRRIVFWNTMLEGAFSEDEIRFVLAHEYAHHSRGHLVEGLAWYALFALPGAWLVARATRRRGGMGEPAAVPVSLLVLVALDLAATPVYNLISRHMEREADWVGLETARDPDAAVATFRSFTTESLNDPDPPRWSYLVFDSHPTIRDRIALAEAWKRSR